MENNSSEYRKIYRRKNIEKVKEWERKSRENYKLKHAEKQKEYSRKYREKNKEKHKELTNKWKRENPERWRFLCFKNHLKRKYNLTVEEYGEILIKQKKKCFICEKRLVIKDACIDHNHKTKKIRKILCRECNLFIGFMEKNLERTNKAIKYYQSNGELCE